MDERTLRVLDYHKIIGLLAGFTQSEPGKKAGTAAEAGFRQGPDPGMAGGNFRSGIDSSSGRDQLSLAVSGYPATAEKGKNRFHPESRGSLADCPGFVPDRLGPEANEGA